MDSAFIHQAANELVQNAGTRNIKQIARSCSLDISETSIRRLVLVPPYFVFCSISFRCGGLSIERNQKPLTPEITPERNAPW